MDLTKLVRIAHELDQLGLVDEADELDMVLAAMTEAEDLGQAAHLTGLGHQLQDLLALLNDVEGSLEEVVGSPVGEKVKNVLECLQDFRPKVADLSVAVGSALGAVGPAVE